MDIIIGIISLLIVLAIIYYFLRAFLFVLGLLWKFVYWFFTRRVVLSLIFATFLNYILLIFTGNHLLSFLSKSFQNEVLLSLFLSSVLVYITIPYIHNILKSERNKSFGATNSLKKEYIFEKLKELIKKSASEHGIIKIDGLSIRTFINKKQIFVYEDSIDIALSKFIDLLLKEWNNLDDLDAALNLKLNMEIYGNNRVLKYTLQKAQEILMEADGLYPD